MREERQERKGGLCTCRSTCETESHKTGKNDTDVLGREPCFSGFPEALGFYLSTLSEDARKLRRLTIPSVPVEETRIGPPVMQFWRKKLRKGIGGD
ncbi:hypothetical protein KM043_014931 [Ampulex compressa]|nr:hypothetical protein KM043_014931 [Ampulex compressa]